MRFATREIAFRFTDRLAVPSTEAAFEEITPELGNVLAGLYGEVPMEFERVGHTRGALTLHVKVVGDGEWNLDELIRSA
ncbi:MAG TPA: hypothetical protein DCX61_04755 [Gemmatimonadetes bacterium]|nr:hypothetical protein [Gemmatimonadota bacterium]